ncbi:MAG: tetratricopeptide repeat protein [bacterium]|nr:tetratricopeptide repeat protein [bacterium]
MAADRAAYLDQACGDDVQFREHVEGLLSSHERDGDFLEHPPIDPDSTLDSPTPFIVTTKRIGPYRILERIGEGGFGIVYMAEQEEPIRRRVALKIIKLGMDTKEVIARFEAERQALAVMNHPNIARALDAGATETGRPYFVMELVKGVTVSTYCDQHKLTTQERLELFVPICHAVQHAHQKGIIHRDLKPNNVLVTLHDTRPVPKVIDFGIAKATSQRLTDKTLFTGFRQFLGTPEYMSPDQADICGLDVDTRTDIYSLGVILYELLTGTTPHERKTLRQASYEDIHRIIREVDPPSPSARLHTLGESADATSIAALRKTEPANLSRLIRGDLDWIVMKAMEKDRTRRYQTANDLAADVERHLRHEPVEAGPPGAAYKVGKFVRRHRAGVVAGSIVSASLVLGLTLAGLGFVQANRARAELRIERDAAEQARAGAQEQRELAVANAIHARRQANKSATVSGFLRHMLNSVDPSKALGREITVRYVLDEAAQRIEEGALSEQPDVEADLRVTLGETYQALGLYPAAEVHLRKAVEVSGAALGDQHPDKLRADLALARLLRVRGKFHEAESLLRHAVEVQGAVLGERNVDTLSTMSELALALAGAGRLEEAESIHRQTLERRRSVLGEEHSSTIASMGNLGAVCRALGKITEAEPLLRRALELSRQVLGTEHPDTASAMNNLGLLLEDTQDFAEAETLHRRTYALAGRVFGEDHPRTLILMNDLARVLQTQGKQAEMRPLVEQRQAHLRRAAQQPDADALTLHAYAWELLYCEPADLRDAATALDVAERAVELDGGRDADILATLARAHQMTGDLDQAVQTQSRAVARARIGGPYDQEALQDKLIDYLLESGNLAGAAGVSWRGLGARLGESLAFGSIPGASFVRRSEVLLEQERFGEAAAQLRACLATRQKELPQKHWLIGDARSRLGEAIAGEGRYADAEPLLIGGFELMTQDPDVPPTQARRAVERIIQLYEVWGKPAQVSAWRTRLGRVSGDAPVDG